MVSAIRETERLDVIELRLGNWRRVANGVQAFALRTDMNCARTSSKADEQSNSDG
jgi:hypothetical protein